ncbi:MAG: alkanesulfonate monooxygenase [Frankiaceae bacterium]|jgi:alkanesulfonate monooxygenase|nr:alkanesulfonate monooxygenase [Frankiaceae bacterium]MDQ1726021.1 alkanesulfonate monooxygenase [Frankiaceae bacterium]
MANEVLWYIIPIDGKYPWEPEGSREVDVDYLKGLGQAVDRLGYSGALLATALADVWILGTTLATVTKKLRPLVAVHPGLISPTLLAKMALTFDNFFDGRLTINVINGDSPSLRQYGLFIDHDERYALSEEYWDVFKRLTAGEEVTYEGKYVHVEKASIKGYQPKQFPHVPLWFGGSSDAGLQMAAKTVDVYLSWGEPPALLKQKMNRLRELADQQGRAIRFGLRVHLITRDTEAEAWAWADHLIASTRPETIARLAAVTKATDSVGFQRQFAHHDGKVPDRARDLEIYPNIWPGMSLLRQGPGTALVGSHQQVIERLQEFEALGIDTFILSGNPLLEEAYHVAETILPSLGIKAGGA